MLGGVGKWCIHPSQIEIANRVYAPTREEIDEALAAIQAVQEAEAQGLGAANFNGIMIDAATTRLFQVTVDRARQCGLI
jgi:citrate lyase subunit beta / citryl-CoA lyase